VKKLTASLALDKHIAETIMGFVDGECDAWKREKWGDEDEWCLVMGPDGCTHDNCYPPESPPRYSIDMGRAGQLLGKMLEAVRDEGAGNFQLWAGNNDGDAEYVCIFNDTVITHSYNVPELAICEAALHLM